MKPTKENIRVQVKRDEAAQAEIQKKRDAAKAALPAIKTAVEKFRVRNPPE